jgi:hypothetical protein
MGAGEFCTRAHDVGVTSMIDQSIMMHPSPTMERKECRACAGKCRPGGTVPSFPPRRRLANINALSVHNALCLQLYQRFGSKPLTHSYMCLHEQNVI